MGTIAFHPAPLRHSPVTHKSFLEFVVWCWFAVAIGVATGVIVLAIGSIVAFVLWGAALLVIALPLTTLLALCLALVALGFVSIYAQARHVGTTNR